MTAAGGTGRFLAPVAVWTLTRAALLLCVFKVVTLPGPDVTSDVSVIYHGWSEVLKSGTYPLDDVTWQYPPAAALAILSPALLPFLDYASAFFVLACLCDALVLGLLLYAGRGTGRRTAGGWVWVAGVPLLGTTAYARYDVMVTAVAVAALLAGVRHPRVLGALAAFGALLKVWPVLLLAGTARGESTRRSWTAAAVTAAGLLLVCTAALPGALAFLGFQRDRGTEVESLGALVFHVARQFGWQGRVELNYGSLEFLGPHVPLVSTLALGLSIAAFGWLVVWRLLARDFGVSTPADAAFTAVLLFTTTSRVISPQYMLWLVGLAAVCVVFRSSLMGLPAVLVLVATGVTQLEFPLGFIHVVTSDAQGVTLMFVRNGLLVAAALVASRRLWKETVPAPVRRDRRGLPVRSSAPAGRVSRDGTADTPASAP
ncbi:glycosyltransferase 87 family protein [Streptomyces sp. NPDC051286]|uniref:glycosyltransferase 87 family protein n=1 Tax=Streptomyces sp. NPDC051286 TaxID=3365647 RepID=UPI0037BCA5C0